MKNGNLKFKIVLVAIFCVIISGFYLFDFINAYDDKTTHPAITDEIVDFYNLSFLSEQLTAQQKEWIVQGSIDEDMPPRWINHFYDPVNGDGWKAENLGNVSPFTLQLFSKIFFNINTEIVSSKNWVHNEILQEKYANYGGNRTWENAVRKYAEGNEEYAFKTLGHILHLLEDSTVPDHTRNDTHAHEGSGLTMDGGSPYEDYGKNFNRQNLDIAQLLKNENKQPVVLNSIDDYFDALANYSNQYFFSEHTINSSKYNKPKILREDSDYGYGKDENEKEFVLVKVNYSTDEYLNRIKLYTLRDSNNLVLSSYFPRLSVAAVLHGAGVIKLFKEQAEKAKNDRSLITEELKISWWQEMRSPLYGSIQAYYSVLSAINNVIDKTVITLALVGNSFSNSFSDIFQNIGLSGLSANLIGQNQVGQNQESVQYSGFQYLENQINQANQIVEQLSVPINENQNKNQEAIEQLSNQLSISNRQQILAKIQAQLDLIKVQAEQLAQQEKQLQSAILIPIQISYGGGGSGSVITIEPVLSVSETQNSSIEAAATSATDSTATSTNETATTTINATSTATIVISAVNHILISEIQAGADGNPDNEFVELYNPADQAVDLTNWSLKRKTSPNATSTKNLVLSFPTSTINAKSFFLIAHKDYNGTTTPDLIYSNNSNPLAYKDDIVILQDSEGSVIDEAGYSEISKGQSLERKAWQNNNCVSAQNENEFSGNGCDTDSPNDFEIREIPKPQNSKNLPEPRISPTTPQNFQIAYSAGATEMKFNWQSSQDYSGATSTLTYKILDIDSSTSTYRIGSIASAPTSTIQISASTTLSIFIDEIGRNYNFSIQAIDKDGLSSVSSTVSIFVPSFISSLHFYYEQTPSFTDYGSPNSIKPVIEASYDKYPFIPDLSNMIYGLPQNNSGKIMVFYLNSEAEKQVNIYGSISAPQNTWPQDTLDKILKLQFNACSSGNVTSREFLMLPDIKDCMAGGAANLSQGINYDDVNEDNHFIIKINGLGVNQPWDLDDLKLTDKDYLTVAYYSFISSSRWSGGTDNFSLAAVDKTKYYLENMPSHRPPSRPSNIASSFDRTDLNLKISFSSSSDFDTLDRLINYEFNYSTSTSGIFDDSNWQSIGRNAEFNFEPIFGNDYAFGIRATDEFNNISEIGIINWSFPSDFAVIQSQLDSQTEFNANTDIVAQVFIPNYSGYAENLKVYSQDFIRGYSGDMQAFIYDTDNPQNVSPQNLLSSSDIINVSDMYSRKYNFHFSNPILLEEGHSYIWLININGIRTGFKGICSNNSVGGSWSHDEYGWHDWASESCSASAPRSYYFILSGKSASVFLT